MENQCHRCKLYWHGVSPCSYAVLLGDGDDIGEFILRHLCNRDSVINDERVGAKRYLEKQAGKMIESSNKRFKGLNVGESVMVRVPDVDRGRVDFRNI